jgi:hypothetical protein
MFSENIHITFEREANIDSFFMSKQLSQNLVKNLTIGKGNKIDQKGIVFITKLQ